MIFTRNNCQPCRQAINNMNKVLVKKGKSVAITEFNEDSVSDPESKRKIKIAIKAKKVEGTHSQFPHFFIGKKASRSNTPSLEKAVDKLL